MSRRVKRLTANPLQRKRPALAPLSFRSQNSRPLSSLSLNVKPLKLKPLTLAAALAASCAGLSAAAGAQPMAVAAERGDLALVPYYTVRGQWVTASIYVTS